MTVSSSWYLPVLLPCLGKALWRLTGKNGPELLILCLVCSQPKPLLYQKNAVNIFSTSTFNLSRWCTVKQVQNKIPYNYSQHWQPPCLTWLALYLFIATFRTSIISGRLYGKCLFNFEDIYIYIYENIVSQHEAKFDSNISLYISIGWWSASALKNSAVRRNVSQR